MRALLSHETGDAIRDFIVERGLKPGDGLPSEAELATLLDVGKTSVREALRRRSRRTEWWRCGVARVSSWGHSASIR